MIRRENEKGYKEGHRYSRDRRFGFLEDKLGIIFQATLKIGVAFSEFNTFGGLCCSNQAEKMLKYIEDFSKKSKTQTKL